MLCRKTAVGLGLIALAGVGLGAQQPQRALPPTAPTAIVSAATDAASVLVVPAGTAIPATLIADVRQRSTPIGGSVRAQVAFPVLAGGALAIPAGSFLEGTLQAAPPASKANRHPARVLHFTRLLLANGATVSLDATMQQARLGPPATSTQPESQEAMNLNQLAPGHGGGSGFAAEPQIAPLPTVQPPPDPGPNKAVVFGAVIGGTAALLTGVLIANHLSKTHADSVEFAAGAQITVVLAAPLTLRSADVTASAAMGPR